MYNKIFYKYFLILINIITKTMLFIIKYFSRLVLTSGSSDALLSELRFIPLVSRLAATSQSVTEILCLALHFEFSQGCMLKKPYGLPNIPIIDLLSHVGMTL